MPFLRRFPPGIALSKPSNNDDMKEGPPSVTFAPASATSLPIVSPPSATALAATSPLSVITEPNSRIRALMSSSPLSANSFCASSAAAKSALVPAVFLESSNSLSTSAAIAALLFFLSANSFSSRSSFSFANVSSRSLAVLSISKTWPASLNSSMMPTSLA